MYKVTLYKDINDTKGTILHTPNLSKVKLTSGDIAQGINMVDSFTFTMNMNNPGYLLVQSLKSLVTVFNTKTNKIEFDGYVIKQSGTYGDDGNYHKTILCASGLNYLKQSVQEFGEFRNMTPKEFLQKLIDVHNSQLESYKHFKLGTVNVTNSTDNVYRFTDQEMTTFETIFDKLIDRLGGELRARRVDGQWYLDWMVSFGESKTTQIRAGRNLKSQERDYDTESVVTRWYVYGSTLEVRKGVIEWIEPGDTELLARIEIDNGQDTEFVDIPVRLLPQDVGVFDSITIYGQSPYWYFKKGYSENSDISLPRLDLKSVNNGKAYIDDALGIAQFGVISDVMVFDDVTQPNNLLTKTIQHRDSYKQVTINNQVDAYDLSLIGKDIHSYEVYNSYPLNNPGITSKEMVRVVEKRIDINNPQASTLTIGDKFQTASQYQANVNKNQKVVQALRKTVASQTASIVTLRNSNKEITDKYNKIQQSYDNVVTTLEIDTNTGTSIALQNLKDAIDDIGSEIISYGPVTATEAGLMIPTDKVKLDNLQNYTEATQTKSGLFSMSDKSKLDLISVETPIDLNDLLSRVEALEPPTE